MEARAHGIHHVTAIASDPQQNIDFYAGLLGLRLVKLTVNFDDPGAYHLYYGDELGHPGTILTFFAWPGARRGRIGTGQVGVTSFAVPPASLSYWRERLTEHGVRLEGPLQEPAPHFDRPVLAFADPDGLQLELVADERAADVPGWDGGPVPAEHAIRGLHGVTLLEEGDELTDRLLRETLGFEQLGQEGQSQRYATPDAGPGLRVEVRTASNLQPGIVAVGTVHHVAFRVPDDRTQLALRATLAGLRYDVTPVLDRQYFHSIYFREPGGVLFEIATDPPGFTTDESPQELGAHLKLPPWLEPHRREIERALPPVRLPAGVLGR